jgi:orotidine-5'-phosphate decarboxylase
MSYLDFLRKSALKNNSIVCVGLDPIIEKIPIRDKPGKAIEKFYIDMIERMKAENCLPGAFKPNIAYYEQYGFEGLRALKKIIRAIKKVKVPLILDAKRGDIGSTSTAYAKALFDFWKADAITVAPYMGSDSVGPFLEYCKQGKGVYILNRTSNPGAKDMQDYIVDGKTIYLKVSDNIVSWHQEGIGAVVGATYPQELEQISQVYVNSGKKVAFLIPGVGGQGGSAVDVMNVLRKTGNEIAIHRINSSSAINYAYQKEGTDDYAGAAVRALKKLNEEIGKL